jgi:DNA primase
MPTYRIIRPSWNKSQEDDRVARAKKFPIEKLYEGQLRRTGKVLMGKCCFHEEDTASLALYPDDNSWCCYAGCGAGDVISFYQRKTGCSFKQAVEELNHDR